MDAAETMAKFMVEGMPDPTLFTELIGGGVTQATVALEGGSSRVVAFGEMVALLWAEGNGKAAIQLEQLWNGLVKTHSFYLHCAYPMGGFQHAEHGEAFLKICSEHSGVIPQESYTALNTEEERLRDIAHLQQKAQALESETAERKVIEKSLKRREAELADILENAVEGVQQVGSDQKIIWANKALMNLLGYTEEEYVGHSLADFHAHRDTFNEFWQRLMRREDIYNYPAQFRCKDGSVKDVLINSNGFWEAGEFVHTRCFLRDVTEQKRIERALNKNHEELELRVIQRTAEITKAHEELRELSRLREFTKNQPNGVVWKTPAMEKQWR